MGSLVWLRITVLAAVAGPEDTAPVLGVGSWASKHFILPSPGVHWHLLEKLKLNQQASRRASGWATGIRWAEDSDDPRLWNEYASAASSKVDQQGSKKRK